MSILSRRGKKKTSSDAHRKTLKKDENLNAEEIEQEYEKDIGSDYCQANALMELEVWKAVSSLPWRWQGRRSRRSFTKITDKKQPGDNDCTHKYKKQSHFNTIRDATTSVEDEVVLRRILDIFALDDWSTDIEKLCLNAKDMCENNGTRKSVGNNNNDNDPLPNALTFTEIDIGSPLTPNSSARKSERQTSSSLINTNSKIRNSSQRRNGDWNLFSRCDFLSGFKTPTKVTSKSSWTPLRFNSSPRSWIFSTLSPITPLIARHVTEKAQESQSGRKASKAIPPSSLFYSSESPEISGKLGTMALKQSVDCMINHEAIILLDRVRKKRAQQRDAKDTGMYEGSYTTHEMGCCSNECNIELPNGLLYHSQSLSTPMKFPGVTSNCISPQSMANNKCSSSAFANMAGLTSQQKGDSYNFDNQCNKSSLNNDLHHFWANRVVPNWQILSSKTKKENERESLLCRMRVSKNRANSAIYLLWCEGLPATARQFLWPLAIGNELKITEELFEICSRQTKTRTESESLWQLHSSLLSSLEMDIQRTVEESHLSHVLQRKPNMKSDMLTVLEGFARYRPDVGYVQGMTYICSILLLHLEPTMAFICFVNVVSQDIFMSFFRFSNNRRKMFLTSISRIIETQHPDLNAHMEELGVAPDMYMVDWLVTLFARSLRLECLTRLWDCYALDGVSAIYRATLSVLTVLKSRILATDSIEQCLPILKNGPMSISEHQLFECYTILTINANDVTDLCAIAEECYSPRPVTVRSKQGNTCLRVRVYPGGSTSPVKMRDTCTTSFGTTPYSGEKRSCGGSFNESYNESPLSPVRNILGGSIM